MASTVSEESPRLAARLVAHTLAGVSAGLWGGGGAESTDRRGHGAGGGGSDYAQITRNKKSRKPGSWGQGDATREFRIKITKARTVREGQDLASSAEDIVVGPTAAGSWMYLELGVHVVNHY